MDRVHYWPISDVRDIGDFMRRSRRSAKIAIAAPGTPGDFRRSAYKIAKCVAGLSSNMGTAARRGTGFLVGLPLLFLFSFVLGSVSFTKI